MPEEGTKSAGFFFVYLCAFWGSEGVSEMMGCVGAYGVEGTEE